MTMWVGRIAAMDVVIVQSECSTHPPDLLTTTQGLR